jgi:hypothetical protein
LGVEVILSVPVEPVRLDVPLGATIPPVPTLPGETVFDPAGSISGEELTSVSEGKDAVSRGAGTISQADVS